MRRRTFSNDSELMGWLVLPQATRSAVRALWTRKRLGGVRPVNSPVAAVMAPAALSWASPRARMRSTRAAGARRGVGRAPASSGKEAKAASVGAVAIRVSSLALDIL